MSKPKPPSARLSFAFVKPDQADGDPGQLAAAVGKFAA